MVVDLMEARCGGVSSALGRRRRRRKSQAQEGGTRPEGDAFLPLGEVRQPGGKIVQAWAIQGDWDAALIRSNTFEMEWPPRSGRRRTFPEIDRAAWFRIADARRRILKGQTVFIDRLVEARSIA
jgi:predicted NUDIX family NTP pyrophosphohydrolase